MTVAISAISVCSLATRQASRITLIGSGSNSGAVVTSRFTSGTAAMDMQDLRNVVRIGRRRDELEPLGRLGGGTVRSVRGPAPSIPLDDVPVALGGRLAPGAEGLGADAQLGERRGVD